MAEAAGAPPEFFKKIPLYVAIFSGGFSFLGSVIKPLGSLINFVAFICRKVRFGDTVLMLDSTMK